LKTNNLGNFKISIYDVNGEILKKFIVESSNNLKNIDLREFNSGVNYINVSRGTDFEIRKILIII